jgi:L-alanine-DL-glutamate epimerase-like enolase superfamily enzyme
MQELGRALGDQGIESVRIVTVRCDYPRVVGRNALLGSHGGGAAAPAAVLRTRDGAVGWGLVDAVPADPSSLVGRRLADLIQPDTGVIDPSAMWADFALHDLAGVVCGVPVHVLLGAQGTTSVPVYDASVYFDDLDAGPEQDPVRAVIADVEAGWEAGHRSFKLKIGRGYSWMPPEDGMRRDIAVTRGVAEAFPGARLLVDANNGYTVGGFIDYLEAVSDVDLFWVEEPFQEHRNGLIRLKERLARDRPATLIADGEHRPEVSQMRELAIEGLVDVLLMDAVEFGLTRWRALVRELGDAPARFSPHAWGLPVKTAYAAHMAAGFPRVPVVEGVPGTSADADLTGYRVVDGVVSVPDAPGFGMELLRPVP